jgi:hypothetical protein
MLSLLRFLTALALLSPPSVLAAQNAWLENGKSAPRDPNRASDGAFGAMLVLTDDWDGFTQRWEHPSAGFEVPRVSSIQKGHPLMSAIIFTGCRADPSGNCSVSGDFLVIDPNGKTYADQKGVNIWSLPPPPDRHLELSAGGLGLSLDPPDPLGTYAVIAHVTDRVSNKTLELRTTFQAK